LCQRRCGQGAPLP